MTNNTNKTVPAKKTAATLPRASGLLKAEALANVALRPSVNAAAVMVRYTKPLGDVSIAALADSLSAGIDDMWTGDMKRAEAMLYGQAHALQSIFMNLAQRAASQEYLKQWDAYLRMAMKAQNQCRMTLETLAMIKNPPVVFARQANINNGGQQQVNNSTPTTTTSGRDAAADNGHGFLQSVAVNAPSASIGSVFPTVDSKSRVRTRRS
jgi:hypothetical protein